MENICEICLDEDDILNKKNAFKLGCNHEFHITCLNSYIISMVGDKSQILDSNGIRCPINDGYIITDSELLKIVKKCAALKKSDVKCATEADAKKPKLFIEHAHEEAAQKPTSVVDSDPYIQATTKMCPGCKKPNSHFHGHKCHHITCMKPCQQEYCYACLNTAEMNLKYREQKSRCLCGSWSKFCSSLQSPSDIKEFLRVAPYPNDTRCGCQICPECKFGTPCGSCDGTCCVCTGHVRPGPDELGTAWSAKPDPDATLHLSKYAKLYEDAKRGNLAEVVEAIRDETIDVNKGDKDRMSALHWAANNGNSKVVKALLKHPSISVNNQNRSGQTPLSLAAKKGYFETVSTLIRHERTDVNKQDNEGNTPLQSATNRGFRNAVLELLDSDGVEVNNQDNYSNTALHVASANGYHEIVSALLEYPGIDANIQNNQGNTPLHLVADYGDIRAVEALLLCPGIDANKQNNNGNSPLHRVANNGYSKIASMFLKYPGIDVNKQNNEGNTPLHLASDNFRIETIEVLLSQGKKLDDPLDPFIANKNKETPRKIASNKRCWDQNCLQKQQIIEGGLKTYEKYISDIRKNEIEDSGMVTNFFGFGGNLGSSTVAKRCKTKSKTKTRRKGRTKRKRR